VHADSPHRHRTKRHAKVRQKADMCKSEGQKNAKKCILYMQKQDIANKKRHSCIPIETPNSAEWSL